MSIALVTNYLSPYRLPLYRLLADRYGVEPYCFGGEGIYVPDAFRDLDAQLAQAPFAAHRLVREWDAATAIRGHQGVITTVAGRVAVPAAYLGARRARKPFVLWTSLWRHPRTVAHLASFPLMRHLYRRADAVLTYGPHVSRHVSHYRGSDSTIFSAPQAVEPEIFARPVSQAEVRAWRAEVGLPDGAVVLFAGRLVAEKGVEVLLGAWRRLAAAKRACLCLVGDGPLEQELARSNAPRVVLTGRLPRERLPVAYATADLVVVPSVGTRRFLEPWGLVCNEAMSQGRPVIATTAVGAAAGGLVRNQETGIVVRERDELALAGAIRRLLEDDALRERLGRQGKKALEDYSYDRAADAFGRALESAGLA